VCGILGYSQFRKRLPSHVLRSAIDSLVHRGPNYQGSFVTGDIALGAVRLRILDLENGDQPFRSADGDVTLAFNGEIFNHQEIRSELQRNGVVFRTRCDTEVVLEAFRFWGSACFARLRGMFAIAVWVESERRLMLVRDPMGIKPLYYYLDGEEIYFGSELKCILAHPGVPRRISHAGLNCFLHLNYVPGPLTLVEGIAKLMPGHLLEWCAGNSEVRGYTSGLLPAAAPRTIEGACEELDHLLGQAVHEQLVSDVPVGIWLSGGLDSSTILHYAAQAGTQNLRTFSVTFKGRSFDERKYIQEVSQRYGAEHYEFDLNETADLADAIEQISYYSDEPSADAGAVPAWYLSQMTRRQVTVVLGGEGADELFAGYLTYRADRYSAAVRKLPRALLRTALQGVRRWPVSDDKISFEYKLKRFLEGSLLSARRAHVFWNGTFTEEEKRELYRYADRKPMTKLLNTMQAGGGLASYLEFDQRYYLPDDILYKVDRISMAHSLEVRPPFLDTRIVNFAASLPDDFKLRGATSKYVLRRLMRDRLPASVLQRPKIGFDIPVHDWLRGVLRPLLLDTLTEEAVSASGLFHWPAMEHLLGQHLERKANVGYHLWGLLVLFLWMRRWKVELPAEESREVFAEPLAQGVAAGLY
jgi:asparagine synthase (glutamine-hydrolysing)